MSTNFGKKPPVKPDLNPGSVNADGFTVGSAQTPVIGSDGAVSAIYFLPGTYTVAQVNALSPQPAAGSVVYVSNGNAGVACLAVRVGASWLRIALGTAVSAT